MSRSLVVAPQWIGDAVMAEPLLAALAARGERLTVAALPWVAPVFRAMPQVEAIVELPFAHGRLDGSARRRVAASLRGRFDIAYVLPNSLKSALVPWLAGVPRRVGYQGEGRFFLLNERLQNPKARAPMVAYYAALAGAGSVPGTRPRLVIDADARDASLRLANLQPDAYWAFAPGAEYGPAKRWPADHYAALARSLHGHAMSTTGTTGPTGPTGPNGPTSSAASPGSPGPACIALLGSPGEASLCEEIASLAPGTCNVLAGRTSLFEAMALIASARGLVSNDSGLMHVAAAFGVPQVGIFGSTSPAHTPPLNERARVLWLKAELQLECMPCFDRRCRFGHTRCLVGVTPERVESALDAACRVDADRPEIRA